MYDAIDAILGTITCGVMLLFVAYGGFAVLGALALIIERGGF